MRKIIVFDIDRTLVDSLGPETNSMSEAVKTVTGKELTKEELNRFMSSTTEKFLKSFNYDKEVIDKICHEWGKAYVNYKTMCFPGMKDVIKWLDSNGYTIGIITSRTLDEFHELDEELSDIVYTFKAIVTCDLIEKPKPDRSSIDYLCNILKCTCDDVIYVGDSKIDMEFASNSGVAFIPACFENQELSNEENACFDTKELISIIKKLE